MTDFSTAPTLNAREQHFHAREQHFRIPDPRQTGSKRHCQHRNPGISPWTQSFAPFRTNLGPATSANRRNHL
jgi:hypothetical protein